MTPLIRELQIWWNTFKRDTSKPLSPYLPQIVLKLNKLTQERNT